MLRNNRNILADEVIQARIKGFEKIWESERLFWANPTRFHFQGAPTPEFLQERIRTLIRKGLSDKEIMAEIKK